MNTAYESDDTQHESDDTQPVEMIDIVRKTEPAKLEISENLLIKETKAFQQLFDEATREGAKNPGTKAVTDLIAQAIENKSYKFIRDIRDSNDDIVIKQWDVIVLFSFVNEATFYAVNDPSYDGNVMSLIRSNDDGTKMLQLLYEG